MLDNIKRYNPIGEEEKQAAMRVLDSGCLSAFIGNWGDDFHGGPEVQQFEKELADYFNSNHAITFNSLTSGLIAAVGAMGIEPGDEVIVSPWTMCATATAIVIWGGIPVFVDIEPEFYGLDPDQVKGAITDNTKAIIVTDIFGQAARLEELKAIADQHQLKLIEDVAQAPGIKFKDRFCGTWGDIGGFSLNYHKHIHTGEGGFCLTDDDDLALRMKMIRNHAEASVRNSPIQDLTNMVGFNFRLGEIEAAIGREQLKKLPLLLQQNQEKAELINRILSVEPAFKLSDNVEQLEHAYYILPIQLLKDQHKRQPWLDALTKKGVPGLFAGYENVHRFPMYQQKTAFGKDYPWNMAHRQVQYGEGVCPVAEQLKDHSFVGLLVSMFDLSEQQCRYIGETMLEEWQAL